MKKRGKWGLAVLCAVLFAGGICAGMLYYYLFSPVVRIERTAYIYIVPQDNPERVMRKIEEAGKTTNLRGFEWMASYYGYEKNIRTGRYALCPGDNSFRLFRRLSAGMQSPVDLVVPSVRTMDKLARSFSKQLMLDSVEVAAALADSAFCSRFGYTPQTIACMFVPDTYQVYWNISLEGLFRRMQKENRKFWNEKRLKEAEEIGFTPEEVVTIASIVDEETANVQEKPVVAGLYINRLHKGMFLQADPTVKFALQDFSLKRIRNVHLETDSPYNTYKHEGLPPGPIRIPSVSGIESVLHYSRHNYLYMCAKEDFSGTHRFTSDYGQHQLNARRYQRELDRRRIR